MRVPKLRFKNDDGSELPEWKKEAIHDLFSIKAGGDISKENVSEIKTEKFKYPVFANSDKNYGLYGFTDIFKVGSDAITVTGRGNLGVAVPRFEPFYPIVRLLVLTPKFEFDIYFGATQINNINFHSESTGVPQLTAPQLSKYEIWYPVIEEQTKIANFLKAVDEKISQLSQKHDLLTQYKKGVMQKIFSQELRFKDDDGRDFPEWEEMALGEVGEIITGKTPSTSDEKLWDGEIQFVTPTDISENKYQYKTQRTVVQTEKLKVLPKHSIMFTCIASIGKMSLSIFPCITNQQINSLVPKAEFDNEYVFYALLSISDFIKSTQANTTLPIINKTEFSKFVIPAPTKKEQTKIANFLSAIDDKINQTQAELDAVKQYKQGLLQQMFV